MMIKSTKNSKQERNMTLQKRALVLCPVHNLSTPVLVLYEYQYFANISYKINFYK